MSSLFKTGQTARVSGYLPAILALTVFYLHIYFGLVHLEQAHQDSQLQEFSLQSTNLLEQMSRHADPEELWVRRLNADFINSDDCQKFLELFNRQRKAAGGRLTCVIWDADGKVLLNDHFKNLQNEKPVLERLYQDLMLFCSQGKGRPRELLDSLKKILGPHLDEERLAAAVFFRHPRLVRPDSAGRFADFWVAWGMKFGAMVFFDRDTLNADICLSKFSIESSSDELHLDFVTTGRQAAEKRHLAWLEEPVSRLEREGRSSAVFAQTMVSGRRISGMKTLVAYKRYHALLQPGKLAVFLAIMGLFALMMFAKGFATGFRINRCSVKLQLVLMLMVTTGLPLLSLMMAASEHVSRKKNALIKNAYQTCIGYLQHVDQRSQINQAVILNQADKAIRDIKKILPQKFGTPVVFKKIRAHLGESLLDARLIASTPPVLMNETGVFADGRFAPFKAGSKLQSKTMLELRMFRDIASYYLSVINNQPPVFEKFTETELIAEMAYQRPFHEIIQNLMLATDKILAMGWGDQFSPVLLKLISLKNDHVTDYFFMLMLRSFILNRDFLNRQVDNLERNQLGLKFLYADEQNFSRKWLPISENSWFSQIHGKTRDHPAVEPCFTTMAGKDYVYAGIKSQNLKKYSFYAFYPLEKIEAQIAEEQRVLLSAGIITIILLIGLAIVFSSNLVLPLAALQAGAIAIRKRDFSFRFSGLADDEFGEMARIFSSSIADFEELSLAGIVQARLLPQQEISDPRFDLFGRSIPMTDLGGDYFDYFQQDGGNYVIMAGDVAGHGVGASLIMAMAKAGVMQCRDCMSDPAEVLARLHQIIHETRSKVQRKVMTFQYLYYNADSGAGIYANAGACSPVLVDPRSGETREITLSAPVLGGFKKSKFANLDLNIEVGQALVFYTDGIIEALNPSGREIGYEGFSRMLLECYDADARKFYDKIYAAYQKWLGGSQPQDDLTLIILVRR